jgi:hypothetical protein
MVWEKGILPERSEWFRSSPYMLPRRGLIVQHLRLWRALYPLLAGWRSSEHGRELCAI